MPKPAARVTDMTQHGGIIMPPCALKTMIEFLPAARVTDLHTCPMVTGIVPHVGGPIIMGSFTTFIEFLPAARVQDQLICVGPPDMIAKGATKTFIGDPAGGASSTMPPPPAPPGSAGGGSYQSTVGPLGFMSSPDGAPHHLCTTAGDPVDVATGRVFAQADDFNVPGLPGLTATRLYSTSLAAQESAWGFGWTHRFDERLEVLPDMIVYHTWAGRRILFPPIPPEEEYLYHLDEQIMLRRQPDGYVIEEATGRRLAYQAASARPTVYWLAGISEGAGRSVEIGRSSDGLLQSVRDSLGGQWTFEAQAGRWKRITAIRHRAPGQAADTLIASYLYDEFGRMTAAQDALGYGARYAYDPDHRLVQRTDRNGYTFSFQYDRWNRCIRTWGQDGLFDQAFFYSDEEPLTTVRDNLGRTTQYHHDPLGLVTQVIDAQGHTQTFDYKGTNLVKRTDALGRSAEWQHDKYGRVTARKSPGGGETATEHRPDGSVKVTDAEGNTRVRSRGEDGAVAVGLADAPLFTETPGAGVISRRDAQGCETQFFFDPVGRLTRTTLPLGQTTEYQHDAFGRRSAVVPPEGAAVRFSYDPLGRLTTVAREGGSAFGFRWDGEGNLCAFVDGNGRATRLEHARFHQLASVTDPLGQTTQFDYDNANRLHIVTDARSCLTVFDYDLLGRLERTLYPDGRSDVANFDPAGQLRHFQDRGGVGSDWTHDADGNLIGIRYADGAALGFTYDRAGRMTGAQGYDAVLAFTYDGYGRLTTETINGQTVAYAYEDAGRLAGMTLPGDEQTYYGYDANGRLTEAGDWHGGLHTFAHSDAGPITEHRFPNGLAARTTLSALGLPVQATLEREGGTGPLAVRRFKHDGNDAVTEITDSVFGRAAFRYDAAGRIQAVDHDDAALSEDLEYDPVGNITRRGAGGWFRYDACNQLQDGPGVRCRHDARGHMVEIQEDRAGTLRFTFNAQGLLTQAVLSDGAVAEYRYDPFGRRLAKLCRGLETQYSWAGHQLIGETTRDADGKVTEQRDYLYRPGAWTPLAMRVSNALYFFHCDHRGAPIRVSDKSGAIVWAADYSAFGEARVRGAKIDQPLRLPGQYFDAETGLHYNRARYYHPRLGRYLSPDPFGLAGGLNLYVYAANDPINKIDPLGRTPGDPTDPNAPGPAVGSAAQQSAQDAGNPAPASPNATPSNPTPSTTTDAQPALPPPAAPCVGAGGCNASEGAQQVLAAVNSALPLAAPDFTGLLRGQSVTLPGVKTQPLTYVKRSEADLEALRKKFDSTARYDKSTEGLDPRPLMENRSNFLKELTTDPAKVSQLKAAGIDEDGLALMKQGKLPDPDVWQVHHKLPLDDGGTNAPGNLVLIRNEPFHKVITNEQKALTGNLVAGETKQINKWPVPDGPVYPPKAPASP